jgi:AraC-like DNA-binding protein
MKKYFKHKLENLLLVNKIVTLHYASVDKSFSHESEAHDFWEIVFSEKGNVIATADGKNVIIKEGEMYFHKPQEIHSHRADGNNGMTVFIASFVCRSPAMHFFENRTVKLTKSQKQYVYQIVEEGKKTFNIPYFNPDMTKMELLPHPALGGEQLIKNHLELLLIDLMRELTETAEGNKIFLTEYEQDNKLVDDIIKLLKENIYSNISIYEISKRTSYSKAYIFKQFKNETGKGVMEYYAELKNKTAKKLLRENELSIKEISEKLCFDTPNYFSKTFKKLNGLTPTQYKKRYNIKLG